MQKLVKNGKNIGEQHRLEHGLPDDEHQLFFDYLQISPSYQLAHRLKTTQHDLDQEPSHVSNWNEVTKTYAICGNVFSVTFLQWWELNGRLAFYQQQEDGTYLPQGPLKLEVNKLNTMTLIKGPILVCFKAIDERSTIVERNRVENWRLGVECNIPSKWTKVLKKNSKKTLDNLEARTALGVLVSKKLKEALYIAENAARGIFPSNAKISTGLVFDGDEIYRIEKNNTALYFAEIKIRNNAGLGHHLTSAVKKYQRKQASNKKIEQEIERQVQIRLQTNSFN
ncbi:hypothetical protein [Limnohabitans sp. Hippo4]|uniref:hypothetical protein n=1 Tax=Limnohabitans sp. Hippo4 TaxID=1826167 RepID=UPI000D373049|nr:hypothetical protein [Limnohabitans sp. Hippo4]PUE36790.1 hypothetical protein B9Z46_08955 [Limnohabitans sp. Hippo4]